MNADFYQKYKYTATLKYNFITIAVFFVILNLPTLIAFLVVPLPENPESVTQCFGYFIWIMLGVAMIISASLDYLFFKFYRLKDPYKMKVEFACQFISCSMLLFAWIEAGLPFPRIFNPCI